MYISKTNHETFQCNLCPHNCKLTEGQFGLCGVRKIENDKGVTINYGEISSIALDPIEKKPLYHFRPGKNILSIGSFGCNFICGFCQNFTISKNYPETKFLEPMELVNLALEKRDFLNTGIAFTYNEPTIWYEYIYDTAKFSEGIDLVLVTNGYISQEPLKKILPFISAMNIDLKSFSEGFYGKVCGGRLNDVLETIKTANSKCHVELTTLLIGDYNDSREEIEELCSWIAEIDKNIPLHLSRYYPTYKFNAPATAVESIIRAREIAKKYLNYVYIGNVPQFDNSTYCPRCNNILVERKGYATRVLINSNICPNCGEKIKIII